ncbi:hypothetical protein MUK70_11820 [Dyadobacter chenwenxiniae]|uniref:Uncharacterized protein n=1 Tax=Dyadobacter chenwenxiniae TaxID=2906456 RepID=A0A9X1PH71_9BACT|nr:hypothetical protein [Dyadobacter chenwenxiniae]MCF0059929.1 hypothetical protein [Dyadobacter chenwenxiniae]UON85668.1 hypothetical protein MUK70_11820 [Dyadobacter chenwenxiniae]
MNPKFTRFVNETLPKFTEHLGEEFIEVREDYKLIRFYDNIDGKRGKIRLQYYPIGDVAQLNTNIWIKERALEYIAKVLLGADSTLESPSELISIPKSRYEELLRVEQDYRAWVNFGKDKLFGANG